MRNLPKIAWNDGAEVRMSYKIFFKGGRLSDEFQLLPVRHAEYQYGMKSS